MQVALALNPSPASLLSHHRSPSPLPACLSPLTLKVSPLRCPRPRPAHTCRAQQQEQDSYVAYDEKKSVFPAEACEEVGGEACEIDGVGPEVKAKGLSAKEPVKSPLGGTDREYVEYAEAKTVFPGEACDELGGEFCEPEYQSGVFPEK